jgi:hypothetical protein
MLKDGENGSIVLLMREKMDDNEAPHYSERAEYHNQRVRCNLVP